MEARKSSRAPRFFLTLPSEDNPDFAGLLGARIPLSEAESHHALRVLRLTVGANIEAIDRKTGIRIAGKLQVQNSLAFLECEKVFPIASSSLKITIAVPLLKAGNTELACEKATELGAHSILVWQAERSIARLKGAHELEHRTKKIVSVCEAAVKQCSRPTLPLITVVPSLDSLLGHPHLNHSSLKLMCSLAPDARPIQECHFEADEMTVVVGPEGDLSERESEALIRNGFRAISLGDEILRAETAVIVSIAMLKALWNT